MLSQYPWRLLVVYVLAAGAIQLLALWAAVARRSWFWRAIAVWAAIMLLLPIRVYEPAVLLTMSAALTIGISAVTGRVLPVEGSGEKLPPPWRFQLADLLVFMLFFATWLALWTQLMPQRPLV